MKLLAKEGMHFKIEKVQNGKVFKAIYLNEDYQELIEQSIREEAYLKNRYILYRNGEFLLSEPSYIPAPILPEKLDLSFIHNCYMYKPKDLFMPELKWKLLIRNILKGNNIMLTGHAGSGKTVSARCAARVLNRPFFVFALGAMQDPTSSLKGNTFYSKEKGTYYSDSRFIQAIQTPNAVILLDELSRAHPEAHNILLTVLDKEQRFIALDEKDSDKNLIYVADGVSFIATANIGNEYTGTRQMDRATTDRFSIIEIDLLSKNEELALVKLKFPLCGEDDLVKLTTISALIRNEYLNENQNLSSMMSTRMVIEAADLINDDFTIGEALEATVVPLFDHHGGAASERTYVLNLIDKITPNSMPKKIKIFNNDKKISPNNPFKTPKP